MNAPSGFGASGRLLMTRLEPTLYIHIDNIDMYGDVLIDANIYI